MPYIGQQLTTAQPSYLIIDDISSSFDGSTTSFALQVNGSTPSPFPVAAQNCLISVGGVVQEPDSGGTNGFNLSGSNIVFSSAPSSGESFWGVVLAGADYVNVGAHFPDGSVSNPSITFDQDTDTGLFRPGVNSVALGTGGSEALRVDSSQRVGIGTQSPSEELVVRADAPSIQLESSNASGRSYGFQANNDGNFHAYDATAGENRITLDSSGRLLVGTTTARSRFFNASGETPTVQIESSGVGTRGLHHLSLTSNNTSSNEGAGAFAVFARSRGAIGDYDSVSSGDAIGSLSFQGADDTDLVEAARITAFVDATPGANDMPGRLSFYTTADSASTPTERMRIDRRGYTRLTNDAFGGSPTRSTGVHHYAHNNLAGDWVMVFENTTTGPYGILIDYSQDSPNNTGREFFYAEDNVGQRFGLRSNGGLANYSGNNVNLCDEREKKNIVDLDSTWDCLKHWELKKFHYNEDADDSDLRYGVIAQQIAPHCPEVISDWVKQKAEDAVLDEDGNVVTPAKEEIVRMSVKEQQMMWMAIKALQEAQTRIETLEAEVAALKGA